MMQAAIATPVPPGPAPAPREPARPAAIADAAREFEAVFMAEMLKPMLETVPVDGPFGGGHGEEMFRGVLADEVGRSLARRGGLGLAPVVEAQLLRLQEATINGR